MTRPASEQPARILLVEGQNDRHVVLHLCNRDSHFQIIEPTDSEESDAPYVVILPKPSSSFHIMVTNGINNLLDSIGPQIIVPDRQAVGILVDANDDFTARWDAVANRLSQEGIDPPASSNLAGTIIDTEGKPRVGIWLMPDNTSPGELEDFVVQMIPAGDRVWPLSNRYIEEIPTEDRKFIESKTQRAKLHAWLAAREDPRQMGLAIKTKDLEIDGPLCQKFVVWLTKLFG